MQRTADEYYAIGREYGVPEHTLGALVRYLVDRCEPGSFLRCFLENDLMGALSRADHVNIKSFKEIGSFVYNTMPRISWGCEETVSEWLSNRPSQI